MNERFFIKASIADRLTYYHLIVFVMVLPFDRLYSELALISLTFHTIIHFRKKTFNRKNIFLLLVPAGIYLLTILATCYTRFYDEAFYEWERQLAMLLFPLIMVFNTFDFAKYSANILLALGISCTVTVIYLYFTAFGVILDNHLPLSSIFSNAFLNHNFSAPIDMHATYLSMYMALAVAAMPGFVFSNSSKSKKWIAGCMGMILCAGMLQLSSRAVLISIAVIINIVMPLFFFKGRQRTVFVLISALFSLAVFFAVTRIDNVRTRFTVDLKEDLTQAGIANNTLEPRMVRWRAAWPIIKGSVIIGHGSGSEIALLKESYFERKLYNSYLNELNVHNQYLSMLIKTGIIGLGYLLFVLVAGFKKSIANRDLVFCSFLVIISIVSFSENILDANKGIFFFAFFYSIFWIGRLKNSYSKIKLLQ